MKKIIIALLFLNVGLVHADQIIIKKMGLVCPNSSEYFTNPNDGASHYIEIDGCFRVQQNTTIANATKTKLSGTESYVFPPTEIGKEGRTLGVISADVVKK